jgi:glycosyltransferase involved in cell wall biosynthesis
VWERTRHKAGAFLRPGPLAGAACRFAAAWAGAAWEARPGRGRPRAGVVVAGYPAQPDALPAAALARAHGAPLVVDMMISLHDTLAGDRGRAGRALGPLLAGADRLALRAAALVLADTAAGARFLVERLGADPARVEVVPVGAEPERFPALPPPRREVHALFYGKLSPLHGLETVVRAARAAGVPPVEVVGEGQLGPWLAGELARDRPPGLRHRPWIPYDELGGAVAAAGICLGIFGTGDKAARVVPNKVWQAMAGARPVITADTPAAREVLRDGVEALLVPPGDAGALARALRRLAADAGLRARMGAAARARYEELGTPQAVASRLRAALERRGSTLRSP